MAEKKECIHCSRSIDSAARVCPYCNREQEVSRTVDARPTIPLPPIEVAPVAAARPSARRTVREQWGMRALVIAAVVGLLMASFAIGGLVYGLGKRGDRKSDKKEQQPPQVAENSSSSEFPQLTLVPENDPTSTIGRSITSVPIPDPDHKIPSEFQRSDATALPSTEYSKLLEQSRKAAQPAPQQIVSADPRVLTAQQPPAYAAAPTQPSSRSEVEAESERETQETPRPRESSPEPRRERIVRTEPVPIHQPLPQGIDESGTMRFRLTVGADGRVKEVRVLETMPGMTGRMIASIQRWKFRPATENGIPVDGTFMVDVSFKASE
jgi:periplasmic protein TonB